MYMNIFIVILQLQFNDSIDLCGFLIMLNCFTVDSVRGSMGEKAHLALL